MPVFEFEGHRPEVAASAWIAPDATLLGRVRVAARASVWFGCVLRADINEIHIGEDSNIQDNSVIHLSDTLPTIVGRRVTVGHKALLHACSIGDETLIGMGAILLDGVTVGRQCLVGAGALITGGTEIPDGSLVLGSPARVVRALSPAERDALPRWAEAYTSKLERYRTGCRPL